MIRKVLVGLTSVWLIAAAALVARVAFVWDQQRKIPHEVLATVPFDNEAGNIANALVQGRGFGDVFRKPTGPTAWLAPVYPSLLAAIFRAAGPFTYASFFAAALLNCVFSAAATVPLYFAGRRVGGTAVAGLAGWLWAISPGGVMLPFEWIWDTSLSVLLGTLLLWVTIDLGESRSMLRWLAYGALWGVALLTNPALGISLPIFLLWLGLRKGATGRAGMRLPALAAGIAILLCVPWTIRNYKEFHRWIPLRSNFAFELWIGNNDIFDEHAVGGIQRITRLGEIRRYMQLGESGFMDEKKRLAMEFMRTHKALAARLIGRRITATWLGTEQPWRDFESTDSWLIRAIFIFNGLMTIGMLAGIVFLFARKNPYAIPVACVPILFPLVYYATHTSLRYRHPIDAVLPLLTAIAIVGAMRRRALAVAVPAA